MIPLVGDSKEMIAICDFIVQKLKLPIFWYNI